MYMYFFFFLLHRRRLLLLLLLLLLFLFLVNVHMMDIHQLLFASTITQLGHAYSHSNSMLMLHDPPVSFVQVSAKCKVWPS